MSELFVYLLHLCLDISEALKASVFFLVSVDLLGLLKWRDNMAGLKNHLMALMKVDGEEVVKVGHSVKTRSTHQGPTIAVAWQNRPPTIAWQ